MLCSNCLILLQMRKREPTEVASQRRPAAEDSEELGLLTPNWVFVTRRTVSNESVILRKAAIFQGTRWHQSKLSFQERRSPFTKTSLFFLKLKVSMTQIAATCSRATDCQVTTCTPPASNSLQSSYPNPTLLMRRLSHRET